MNGVCIYKENWESTIKYHNVVFNTTLIIALLHLSSDKAKRKNMTSLFGHAI